MRSAVEIKDEIDALAPIAAAFDTKLETNYTIIATGAHDALRWALGLAEESISEILK